MSLCRTRSPPPLARGVLCVAPQKPRHAALTLKLTGRCKRRSVVGGAKAHAGQVPLSILLTRLTLTQARCCSLPPHLHPCHVPRAARFLLPAPPRPLALTSVAGLALCCVLFCARLSRARLPTAEASRIHTSRRSCAMARQHLSAPTTPAPLSLLYHCTGVRCCASGVRVKVHARSCWGH